MGQRIESVDLVYSDIEVGGRSNKEYHLQLEKNGTGFVVNFQFGRIGQRLNTGTKTPKSVDRGVAYKIYNQILSQKLAKGYQPQTVYGDIIADMLVLTSPKPSSTPSIPASLGRTDYPAELLEEIDQHQALRLAADSAYLLQKKYDGTRKQIKKTADGQVFSYNKKGEVTTLIGPVNMDIRSIPGNFVIDGEQIGKIFYAFDLLEVDGKSLVKNDYETRLRDLKFLLTVHVGKPLAFVKVSETFGPKKEEKLSAFMDYFEKRAEGVVFKLRSAPYKAGRNGQHKKFKFLKTCSAIVTEVNPRPGKESMSIGLIKDGSLHPVGHSSLLGKPKVKAGDIVEVTYLYATKEHRLYQPRMKEIRTDVDRSECTFSQLIYKGE